MTTPLSKPVYRETRRPFMGRTLIVGLEPGDLLSVRQKGTRKAYTLPVDHLYMMAVKHEVRAAAAAKIKARKLKKGTS